MGVGLLNIAVSGLNAYQQALQTTSNNISNASTPGYSVENAQFATQPEQYTGGGYVGNGVTINTVARGYNQFLNAQVLSGASAYNNSNTYYTMASQIDNMLANQSTGLSSSMNTFFSDVNSVANNPSSVSTRQVMLSDSSALAAQFNSISSTLSSLNTQVNDSLTTSVNSLNGYAANLAQLNTQIVAAENNGAPGQSPNGLLDQRDTLLNQISTLTNASVVEQSNGSVNVYIGSGQPLVMGSTSSTLSAQGAPTDNSQMQVMLNGQNISNQITGGQIAGNIGFRSQVLAPAQQQLGLLATSFATEVNNVQQSGYDLNGNAGTALFNIGTPVVNVQGEYSDPNLVVSATYSAPTAANVSSLSGSYQLTVSATQPDTYTLTNLSNNSSVSGLTNATLPAATQADGFNISFSGGSLTAGDSFQISPFYNAGSTIQLNPAITNPSQIAAASTATNAPGNNTNILAMANLQTQPLMQNGTSTFSQVYSQLVGSVGANTSNAQTNSVAQNTVLQNATSAQQSVSGVNLDVEAANLIEYQNSYQAAAKTVTTAQTLFTAIINAVS